MPNGIDWIYTNSTATREEPKTRNYRYDQNDDGSYSFSRRADSNQTSFGKLTDKDASWRMDVKLPLEFDNNFKISLNSGFIHQQKTRESSIRRFTYFAAGRDARDPEILAHQSLEDILNPEYISPTGFQMREATRSTDRYQASQTLISYYGQLDMNFFDEIRLSGGLRWEDNEQLVETFSRSETVTTSLKRTDMLPSVAATWFISDKQQLRAGFSQTISRPDFRELSPAPFTDPSTNQETTGNPDLKQTNITNYDIRWEYYMSASENFSAGFFWKDMTNPIEKVFLPGTAGLLTYQNADASTVWGFEFEVLKNLDIIHPQLENFYVGGITPGLNLV
jgi:outer membrane receptor protein involved in Fe transport